jgi:hypothetical protein
MSDIGNSICHKSATKQTTLGFFFRFRKAQVSDGLATNQSQTNKIVSKTTTNKCNQTTNK